MTDKKQLEEIPTEGDVQRTKPVKINLCGKGKCVYRDNQDGTATCEACPKGVILGTHRILDGKLVDFRFLASE